MRKYDGDEVGEEKTSRAWKKAKEAARGRGPKRQREGEGLGGSAGERN